MSLHYTQYRLQRWKMKQSAIRIQKILALKIIDWNNGHKTLHLYEWAKILLYLWDNVNSNYILCDLQALILLWKENKQ